MRLAVLSLILVSSAMAETCPAPASELAAAARAVQTSQAATLAVLSGQMGPGVSAEAGPKLLQLKSDLARAVDVAIRCDGADANPDAVSKRIGDYLGQAAPGIAMKEKEDDPDDKPVKGVYGNDVQISVADFSGPPRLLEVEIDASVPCGADGQLLIYERKNGQWTRALRWSSNFKGQDAQAGAGYAWGDFFLREMLVDPVHPENWKIAVAHGTPWCTSRFSTFGASVLGPARNGEEAHLIWETRRDYSRGDFYPRLKAAGDVFELRLHADEMSFRDAGTDAFERLVVYRYRASANGVTRLEPVAANARGFVEEWLSMPWEEAKDQSSGDLQALQQLHGVGAYTEVKETFTAWTVGAVRACREPDSFQIEVTSHTDSPKNGSKPGPEVAHFLHARQTGNGYAMTGVAAVADPQCTGPDLMAKPAARKR